MPGPKGSGGAINLDSYDGATPNSVATAPPKQINATDKKVGPPIPSGLLGGKTGADHKNRDTYYE